MGEILQFKLNNKKPKKKKGGEESPPQNGNNIFSFPEIKPPEITSVLTDEKTGEQISLSSAEQKELASFFEKIVNIGKAQLSPEDLKNNTPKNMLDCALKATETELQEEPRFYFLIAQILIDQLKK